MKTVIFATVLSLAAVTHAAPISRVQYITTGGLMNWYTHGKKMTVIDARAVEFFDGHLLPFATWLPYDAATDSEIHATIGSKANCVVIYCWSARCPAGGYLAERLLKLGYINLYDYKEGIEVWSQHDLPLINY
jgi:rhodanese-related sulfurtransferase